MKFIHASIAALLVLVAEPMAGATDPLTVDQLLPTESGKLTASDVSAGAFAGFAVALDGDTAVVGAPIHDQGDLFATGRAYVFVRDGAAAPAWHLQAILGAPDAGSDEWFGFSVAVSGNTAIVGAPYDDSAGPSTSGAAYVFARTGAGWSLQASLVASDASTSDNLGFAVAVSGSTAVVGATGASSVAGPDTGAAYVFQRTGSTWSEQAKLVGSAAVVQDGFGSAVAVESNTAVVGASADNTPGGTDAGSACVFVRSGTTWTQQAQLFASDPGPLDYFGFSATLSGSTAVIGAPNNNAAYVFLRSGTTWSLQQKLSVADPLVAAFGVTVSVQGDTLAVGSQRDDHSGLIDAGAAYVFVRSGTSWSQQAKLAASDAAAGELFGKSVMLSGDTVFVGAPYDDDTGVTDAGAAYAFVRNGTSWSEEARVVASDVEPSALFGGDTISEYTGGGSAVSGDTAIVGVPWDDHADAPDAGSAWVFVRDGASWSVQALLAANDAASGDRFGTFVAISGDTALVAAPADGSVHVYVRDGTTWREQQKLPGTDPTAVALSGDTAVIGNYWGNTAKGEVTVFVRNGTIWSQQGPKLTAGADATDFDWFGYSVAISGDTLAVGSIYDAAPSFEAGAVHIFVRSGTTWSQQGPKLTCGADAATTKAFGSDVAVSGDTVLVGAEQAQPAGAAYVFVRSGTTWSQQGPKLTPGPGGGGYFGSSVSLSDGLAVVGSENDALDLGAAGMVPGVGAAHVFARSGATWSLVEVLTPPDAITIATPVRAFGASVAVDGDTVVVGAPGDDVDDGTGPAVNAGSAYAIRLQAEWLDLGGGVPGTLGPLTFVGMGALVEGTTVTSVLTGALPNSVATHVVGLSLLGAPFKGGIWGPQPGALIPGLPTGPSGSIVLSAPWPAGIPSGTTVYAQYWMADAGAVKGFAGSNTIAGTTP